MEISYDRAIADYTRIENKIFQVQSQTLLIVADAVVKAAKTYAPVKTGRLRDSIRILTQAPTAVEVGSDVDYSAYQEYGTRKMKAHPFLHPALNDAVQTYPDFFRRLWMGSD